MIVLREYQTEAVNKLSEGLRQFDRVLGWLPTASGKSVIIAEICRRVLERNPQARILVLCHQSDILEQNDIRCRAHGVRSSGIFCAGMNRRDTRHSVIHASRDSLGAQPTACGLFTVVLVDEAHLVSLNEKTRYQAILSGVAASKVVGLTGTPWRLGNGRIYGPGQYWQALAAHVDMRELFENGALCPYVLPSGTQVIKTEGLRLTAGDFNRKDLEAASTASDVVERCLDLWEDLAKGRNLSLVFCCSIAHAQMVFSKLTSRGYKGAVLTEETDAKDRAVILKKARAGEYAFIANVAVLTTGVDLPLVDCLLFLRATQSLSLFIQMAGRGLRHHPGKENCLMLDCAGNFSRLGRPEEPIEPKKRGKKKAASWTDEELRKMGIDPAMLKGSVAIKQCERCLAELVAAARVCHVCGDVAISHTDEVATEEAVFKKRLPLGDFKVTRVRMQDKTSKAGNDMVVVNYFVEGRIEPFSEYIVKESANKYAHMRNEAKLARLSLPVNTVSVTEENGFCRVRIID